MGLTFPAIGSNGLGVVRVRGCETYVSVRFGKSCARWAGRLTRSLVPIVGPPTRMTAFKLMMCLWAYVASVRVSDDTLYFEQYVQVVGGE